MTTDEAREALLMSEPKVTWGPPREWLSTTGPNRLQPWERAQLDRRYPCSCGHAYRDHATGGLHCLGASLDEDQVTGKGDCLCSRWTPITERFVRYAR